MPRHRKSQSPKRRGGLGEQRHLGVKEPEEGLADIAYRYLRNAILSNELPVGFQAAENEIASQLGMSRYHIRSRTTKNLIGVDAPCVSTRKAHDVPAVVDGRRSDALTTARDREKADRGADRHHDRQSDQNRRRQ